MRKRLPIRHSRAATISHYAGVLAIPVLVIGALLHRAGIIDAFALYAILAAGFALALAAVLGAGSAFIAIWRDDARGLGKALRGFILGVIALTPALAVGGAAVYYPRLTDISTDLDTPPKLAPSPRRTRPGGHLDPELQRAAYPDIVPRRFPIGTAQLYAAVEQVIEARGWSLGPHIAPAMNDDPAAIRLEAQTLLLGFTDDMTVRILPDPMGSRLDIRSASRVGEHDLGENARRIRSFLGSLDAVLTEAYGIAEAPESDTAPVEFLPEELDKQDEPDIPVPGEKPGEDPDAPAVSG